MNREIAALYRLPVRSLETIAQQLSQLRQGSGDRPSTPPVSPTQPLPEVTLLLQSGLQLRGEVVQVGTDPAAVVLLRLTQTTNPLDTCYISLTEIAGITVHHSAETLHLLAFDQFRPLTEKVPTRLELERQARAIAEVTVTETTAVAIGLTWTLLPTTEISLQTLGRGLQDLHVILKALMADTLGREALSARVQTIELTCATQRDLKLVGTTLQITGGLVNQELQWWERSALQAAIERLL